MTHTPGPWHREGLHIYGPKHPDSRHRNGRIYIGVVAVGTHRADPHLDGGGERFPYDAHNDAALIAAAPELLDALAIAATTLEAAYLNNTENIAAKVAAERARDAIAKAKATTSGGLVGSTR